MRILLLHADFIEYQPISKEIQTAEDIPSKSSKKIDEVIVALVAVEKDDDESLTDEVGSELKTYGQMIKCDNLLIYPYAHLSQDLAGPSMAKSLLNSIEEKSRNLFKTVNRAPFGWTKSFNIKIKGHPLAEQSKTFQKKPEDASKSKSESTGESIALKSEEVLKSTWYVQTVEGNLVPMDEYTFEKDSAFRKLADYELSKKRTVVEVPPHVKLMKRLALADYEPSSDGGNMRYYPKGRLMKSLIETYVSSMVHEYGGIEVETPIMYDSKHPSMESYFNRFPARQYNIIADNKQLFLRFAACFGQFLMAKDFQISYKHLPLKLYELTRYSFRREKSGELVGLRRLRAFSMPDCHAFCKDVEQAKDECLKRFDLSIDVLNAFNIKIQDIEMAIRFTETFYEENKEFITIISRKFGKPILVEMWKDRFFYFVLKWEFNYVDNIGKAAALSTDQIDVENGKRYNIEYVDEQGKRHNPIILHNSPSGAVERIIYAILEKAAKIKQQGETPQFPLWLSHTQVRIIPIMNEHLQFAEKIETILYQNQIRADIDDRQESLGKRIREAETEWIPYILVIGDKETESSTLVIRDRKTGKQIDSNIEELIEDIKKETKDKPFMPLNLPKYLSKRPQIMV